MKFVGQLKNPVDTIVDGKSMFALMILEKIKERRLNFSRGSIIVLWKMRSYEEARIKPVNIELNKLNSAAKSKIAKTSGITKKNFEDEELSHISKNKITSLRTRLLKQEMLLLTVCQQI